MSFFKNMNIKLFFGFLLSVAIMGFIAVFIAVITINQNPASGNYTMRSMIILTIAAVILGGIVVMAVIAVVMTRAIRLPDGGLECAACCAAKGDLAKSLQDQGKDKRGQTSLAFTMSVEEFSKMISSIQEPAGDAALNRPRPCQ